MTTTRPAPEDTAERRPGGWWPAGAAGRDVGRRALVALFPFLLALAVGAVILLVTGHNPLAVYALMSREAVGGSSRIASTLSAATPLLFTGLATAIAFRAGVFNIGVEGSFVAGGLAGAVIGFTFAGLPGPVLVLASLSAATLAGLAVALGPGLLRAGWGVDEVVTTLLGNFIVIGITGYLVNTVFLAPGVANSASRWWPSTRPSRACCRPRPSTSAY